MLPVAHSFHSLEHGSGESVKRLGDCHTWHVNPVLPICTADIFQAGQPKLSTEIKQRCRTSGRVSPLGRRVGRGVGATSEGEIVPFAAAAARLGAALSSWPACRQAPCTQEKTCHWVRKRQQAQHPI